MKDNRVCPVSHAHHPDNCVRRLMHPAKRIVGRFIREGDTVIDIGCGPDADFVLAFYVELWEKKGNTSVIKKRDDSLFFSQYISGKRCSCQCSNPWEGCRDGIGLCGIRRCVTGRTVPVVKGDCCDSVNFLIYRD